MKPRRIDRKSRNIRITKNFYRSIAIPIRISQISGCGPFLFSVNGIRKSILCYIVFVVQLCLYMSVLTILHFNPEPMPELSLGTHTKIINQISIVSILAVWIIGVFRVGTWSNFLKDLVAIDHGLANFDISVDYRKYVRKNYWMLAALAIQCLLYFYYMVYHRHLVLSVIAYTFIPSWIIITLSHCVSAMACLVYERFQLLNCLLQKLVDRDLHVISLLESEKQKNPLKMLCYVCSWHHNIIKTMTLANETFGLKMVVVFGYAFMIIVMQVFSICHLFKKDIQWDYFIQHIFSVTSYSFTVYKICNICEYTVREAKKSGLLIHQIESDDFDIRDEIEMFSLQISNETIEFTAAGFFPIDYSLLFSIIGGVTTYIIILIQLDTDQQDSGGNSTDYSSISSFLTTPYSKTIY
ncbi:putative gustatory receptor 28b [Harmonia axyridis]|uniref:putative gustatory receptor 28b n=1 Tax=Harmonia axyridis TaxID=115357 RepID=UPI001E277AEA|nr:putative gustatory receptor 28b [Harmonia axyridis]